MPAEHAHHDAPDLQGNISRVVRGLMGLAGIAHHSELADVLNVSRSGVTEKLNGTRKWSVEDLRRLANHFDVSVSVFYDDADEVLRRLSSSGYKRSAPLSLIPGKVPEQAERRPHQPSLLATVDT